MLSTGPFRIATLFRIMYFASSEMLCLLGQDDIVAGHLIYTGWYVLFCDNEFWDDNFILVLLALF